MSSMMLCGFVENFLPICLVVKLSNFNLWLSTVLHHIILLNMNSLYMLSTFL